VLGKALHSELLIELSSRFFGLRQPNISKTLETLENEKFGKFCLTQGLSVRFALLLSTLKENKKFDISGVNPIHEI